MESGRPGGSGHPGSVVNRRYGYWLFFAIIAVGLALSWSLVGKRAQLSRDSSLSVMMLDQDCRPWLSPCAAYATDFALVLGAGPGSKLRLIGERLPASIVFRLMHFNGALELPEPVFTRVDERQWLIGPSENTGRLRVNLQLDNQQWIAEFPLSNNQ